MEEKGIVARDCFPLEPHFSLPGLKWETIAGNNPFLVHVAAHVFQGVKAKVPFPQFILNHG